MAVGIGAAGSVGVAREAVSGTYTAPEIFIPVRSESLNFINEVQFTRPIMGTPDQIHGVTGPSKVEGDIEFEVLLDPMVYLLEGGRYTLVKTGAGPYVYTFTPSPAAEAPNETLSFTIVRNGIVFGYTGCVLGGLELSVDNGVLVGSAPVLGLTEASQSAPSVTWPTDVPMDADAYTLLIASTGVTNADNFSFSVDDSAEAVYRLGNAASAANVVFGERTVEATMERDFENATDYTAFKATTAQELDLKAALDANNFIQIVMHSAITSSYEVNLSGQGDLVRSSITYTGKYNFTESEVFNIVISSDTDIT